MACLSGVYAADAEGRVSQRFVFGGSEELLIPDQFEQSGDGKFVSEGEEDADVRHEGVRRAGQRSGTRGKTSCARRSLPGRVRRPARTPGRPVRR